MQLKYYLLFIKFYIIYFITIKESFSVNSMIIYNSMSEYLNSNLTNNKFITQAEDDNNNDYVDNNNSNNNNNINIITSSAISSPIENLEIKNLRKINEISTTAIELLSTKTIIAAHDKIEDEKFFKIITLTSTPTPLKSQVASNIDTKSLLTSISSPITTSVIPTIISKLNSVIILKKNNFSNRPSNNNVVADDDDDDYVDGRKNQHRHSSTNNISDASTSFQDSSSGYLNITSQAGTHAYLPCNVTQFSNKPISWIRNRDGHILTVDQTTFIADQRFLSVYTEELNNWSLQIKFLETNDTGWYECQVSTEPKISAKIYLKVIEPETRILGELNRHVKAGSFVRIRCIIPESLEPPLYINWLFNEKQIYLQNKNQWRTEIEKEIIKDKNKLNTISTLIIESVRKNDSGNYSCKPSSGGVSATVILHVLSGEYSASAITSGVRSRIYAFKQHNNNNKNSNNNNNNNHNNNNSKLFQNTIILLNLSLYILENIK